MRRSKKQLYTMLAAAFGLVDPKRKRVRRVKLPGEPTLSKAGSIQKFALISKFIAPFRAYINIGFTKRLRDGKSAVATAFSLNYRHAVIGTDPDFQIDYRRVIISCGTLPGLIAAELSYNDGCIGITWRDEQLGYRFSVGDRLMVVVYVEELNEVDGRLLTRSTWDPFLAFKPMRDFQGVKLHIYIAVITAKPRNASDTQYLGFIQT